MRWTPNRVGILVIIILVIAIGLQRMSIANQNRISAEIAYDRAVSYDNNHMDDMALRLYREAIELDPNFADAYSSLCGFYTSQGENDLALENCNRALEVDDTLARAYANRCIVYAETGEYEAAETDCTQALTMEPDDAYLYDSRGRLMDELGRYEEAIADYTRALEMNSRYDAIFYNRGLIYYTLGKYELALADFQQSNELQAYEGAHYRIARTLFELERYEEALVTLDVMLELYPEHESSHYLRGWIQLYEYNKPSIALNDFSRAIEIDAEYGNAYAGRGESYDDLGDLDLALADYCRYIELVDNPDQWYFDRIEELGECPEQE
jgi:tetratricopeptide (TPR) repeat protein